MNRVLKRRMLAFGGLILACWITVVPAAAQYNISPQHQLPNPHFFPALRSQLVSYDQQLGETELSQLVPGRMSAQASSVEQAVVNIEATKPVEMNLHDQLPPIVQPQFVQYHFDATLERSASHIRAGCPLSISKRASITYGPDYKGYYVGGGVVNGLRIPRGEPRYLNEGTWGMDYAPFFTRVASSWSHGRLFQGGIGQYEPDRKNRPFGQTFGRYFRKKESGSAMHHGDEGHSFH